MTNCLSDNSFGDLLFVNVRIQDTETTALFDTGAGMTVVARSILEQLGAAAENNALRAGNNNGLLRTLQTAVISNVRFGDVCVEQLRVLVTDDADFALCDENGAPFPAKMLLGWDVISRYCWHYSAQNSTLSVRPSERAPIAPDSAARQGPIVFPSYAGQPFRARVDTGHTSSTLSAVWHTRLPDVEWHETETVGIGSIQRTSSPYVRELPIVLQGRLIRLRDVDISEKLYGQPADVEALLGYDLLAGTDWQLDQEFRLRQHPADPAGSGSKCRKD